MVILSPKRIAAVLLSGTIFIALVNVLSDLYRQLSGGKNLTLTGPFRLDEKITVPTWYSSSLMLICAVLLGLIAADKRSQGDRYANHWGFLSLLLLLLSVDEVSALHLRVDFVSRYVLQLGVLRYGLYLLIALALGAIVWFYRKFWMHLPRPTQWQIGAVGLFYAASILIDKTTKRLLGDGEYLTGNLSILHKTITSTGDEFLELVGLVVLVYALLSYIGSQIKELHITIRFASGEQKQLSPD
jgi:hypothetical protein